MKNLSITFSCLLLLSACGGGGGGGGEPYTGPLNSSGYPDVAGYYSYLSQPSTTTCTNGYTADSSASSFNVIITQSVNSLSLSDDDTDDLVDMTINEINEMGGNVETNGDFIVTQSAVVTIDSSGLTVTMRITLDGRFTAEGWSGDDITTWSYHDYDISCENNRTFSGNKLSKAQLEKTGGSALSPFFLQFLNE